MPSTRWGSGSFTPERGNGLAKPLRVAAPPPTPHPLRNFWQSLRMIDSRAQRFRIAFGLLETFKPPVRHSAMNAPISRRSALCNLAGGTAAAAAAACLPKSAAAEEPASVKPLKGQDQPLRLPLVLRQHLAGRSLQGRQGHRHQVDRPAGPAGVAHAAEVRPDLRHGQRRRHGHRQGLQPRWSTTTSWWPATRPSFPRRPTPGIPNVICLSGNRGGLDDEQGMKNCAMGLKRLMKLAEQKKVNVVMELLNSKRQPQGLPVRPHGLGRGACASRVGSERFKLLYDIYHMQIMEGDLIATIRRASSTSPISTPAACRAGTRSTRRRRSTIRR